MAFGITEHDVLDPNLLNMKFEELDARFSRLPLGAPEDVSDKIRENLHGWGDFYWNHPTGFIDPKLDPEKESTWRIRSWCKGGAEVRCIEGTRWNQVYRETLSLLAKAEAATAGLAPLEPTEPGEVVKEEEVTIIAKKPLWWLLVPVVFLLGGALIIKPRRLREAGPLPKPVPVDGVDDIDDTEDCGCDDALGEPPAHHLDRAAQSITLFNEQIGFLRKSIKGDCREAFADLLGAEHQRSIALTNLNTVVHDPESTKKEVAAAKKESKQLERFEIIFTKLEEKFTSSCVR